MVLKACLLAYTKSFAKTSTPAPGDDVTVTANVTLLIPEVITDYFNIPTVENAGGAAVQHIESFTYSRYDDFGDSTGVTTTVSAHDRTAPSGRKGAGKVIRLPHESLLTSKGRPRTCSIRFPSFFSILMLDQAIGSMLKLHQPLKWKLDNTGKSYPFVPNTSTGVLTGRTSGAWVVAAPVNPVNTADAAVGDVTVVASKGK